MTYDEALQYFKTPTAMARELRVKPPSVMEWKDGIPELRQYQIELATKGALKSDFPPCGPSDRVEYEISA